MKAMILGIPKGFWSNDWNHNFINALPMGVFAIANYCNERQHNVLVGNAAVYGYRERALQIILQRINDIGAEVIGLPLHWHLCGYDVIRTAAYLKDSFPDRRIVLGGLTASIYAQEILDRFQAIDGVIVGDGEIPFCNYLDVIETSRADPDFSGVPNLTWRCEGQVVRNAIKYVATSDQLSSLDFSPQRSIFSLREYANGLRMVDAIKGIPFDFNQDTAEKLFFMNIGRGCSYNCAYCAGSRIAHATYTCRSSMAIRSPASVTADFRRCYDVGLRRFHLGFDCAFKGKEDYFRELFSLIQSDLGPELDIVFEAYALPSSQFIKAISMTFRWAGVILSPCLFGDAERRRYKGYSYSNQDLFEKIREITSFKNCQAFVYYAVTPLEDWSQDKILQRRADIRNLQDRYGCEVSVMPIYAEPGSPWVSFESIFDTSCFRLSFDDFFIEWERPLDRWNDRLTGIAGTDIVMRELEQGL